MGLSTWKFLISLISHKIVVISKFEGTWKIANGLIYRLRLFCIIPLNLVRRQMYEIGDTFPVYKIFDGNGANDGI